MFRAGVDEVHEASTAIELGEEDGGVCLRFRALDPLQTGSDAAVLTATFSEHPASVATHPHFSGGISRTQLGI